MIGYCVTVEVRSATDESALEDFAELLTPLHGAVAADGSGWSATVTLDAGDLEEARDWAMAEVLELAEKVGLPTTPVVRAEVIREDLRDAELQVPSLPDLVSGPEVAEILAVSRQRVHQLAAGHSEFPAPLYRLGVGSLWSRAGVERFAETWERRPGRPRLRA